MDKKEIANILNDIGLLLELKGENPFKSRAYYNAARTIELLEEDIETLVKEDRLKEIKGIGEAINKKITELVLTGKMEYYENLKASIPEGLVEMLKIPGLGPKKIKIIYEKLNITTIRELEYACIENRLVDLPGFGEKTQKKIWEGIQFVKQFSGQHLYAEAYVEAVKLKEYLENTKTASIIEIAGSLRRKKEIVKDIDILAAASDSSRVMEAFVNYPGVKEVIAKGDTKTSVTLKLGINADLRVVTEREFPYALHHFTGSREHNTAMRHRAKQMGIKMNEYGLFKGDKLIECKSEEEIFNKILAAIMLMVLAVILFQPHKRFVSVQENLSSKRKAAAVIAFFFVGIYGGFIQAGVGFIIIATLSVLTGLSLVKINSLKVFIVAIYTLSSLLVFLISGNVN
ncbi:MAG: polymerase, partial [Thermoanaerobacter sp.]|nr:polymerase [Thermoanaerobacter sp.]